MRRVLPVIIVVAGVVLLFCSFKFFFPSKDAGPGGPGGFGGGMPPSAVDTVVVRKQALPNSFETVGTLRASQSISLRPEVAGPVESIGFNDGQAVSQGQVLFQLDDALVRAALNEAVANLQNSKRAYDRASELAAKQ